MYLCSHFDLLGIGNFYFLFGGSEVKHELMVALWDDKLLKLVLKQHMTSMRQFLGYDELRIRWVDLGVMHSSYK